MNPSPFAHVELAPKDPILGVTQTFKADTRSHKVNLGVGVYTDAAGKLPLMAAVRQAEEQMAEAAGPRGYLPFDGFAAYVKEVQKLLFGQDSTLLADGRVATIESLGGTGALKVGADFIRRISPDAALWISDPSWENHQALFTAAGFKVNAYPYYDPASHGVRFQQMLDTLNSLPAGDVVVLHACCHNPTGVDLDLDQWRQVVSVCESRELIPFLDMAYQGFADGIEEDAATLRLFADSGMSFFVASSFSKSFALYGERVGALSIVTASQEETVRIKSRIQQVVRTNYSNPPTHGATIVATVLADPALRKTWEDELTTMRERIAGSRKQLIKLLDARKTGRDFSFVTRQRGMFSYSGLSADQVGALAKDHAIYAIASGRICLAAINDNNIEAVADAIAAVL